MQKKKIYTSIYKRIYKTPLADERIYCAAAIGPIDDYFHLGTAKPAIYWFAYRDESISFNGYPLIGFIGRFHKRVHSGNPQDINRHDLLEEFARSEVQLIFFRLY